MNWFIQIMGNQLPLAILFSLVTIIILVTLFAKFVTALRTGPSSTPLQVDENFKKGLEDVEMNQKINELEGDHNLQHVASQQLDALIKLQKKTSQKEILFASIAIEKEMNLNVARRRSRLNKWHRTAKSRSRTKNEKKDLQVQHHITDKRVENPAYYEPADHDND